MADKTRARPGKAKVPDSDERAAQMLKALPDLDTGSGLFDSPAAQAYSCYASIPEPAAGEEARAQKTLHIVPDGKLWPTTDAASLVAPQGEAAHDMLRAHILGEYFPCIGARSAFMQGTYRFGFYKEIGHLSSVAAMGRDLRRFTTEYEQIGNFTTFIAAFKRPASTSEDQFEKLLWKHLQTLHNHDGDGWDPHYSPDPENPGFAFSFNGHAFFVVGMHPGASRFSRRNAYPILIFNPESQIRRLKDAGALDRFANTVRDRDTLYQGSINPSLPVNADSTGGEAAVYSGKHNPPDGTWKCPFHTRQAVLDKAARKK